MGLDFGFLLRFPSRFLISGRRFQLISTDFTTQCTRFLLLPAPRRETISTIWWSKFFSAVVPGLALPNVKELSNAVDAVVDWRTLGIKLGLGYFGLRKSTLTTMLNAKVRCWPAASEVTTPQIGRWWRMLCARWESTEVLTRYEKSTWSPWKVLPLWFMCVAIVFYPYIHHRLLV